jgi:hypothetical protein
VSSQYLVAPTPMIERGPKRMLNARQNYPIFAVVELAIRSEPAAALWMISLCFRVCDYFAIARRTAP